MNNNTHKQDFKIINIGDFVVELLRSWKYILILMIIFAVLGGCFGGFRQWKKFRNDEAAKLLKEEELNDPAFAEAQKEGLTQTQVEETERLYEQYLSYVDYRKVWQEVFSSYLNTYDGNTDDQMVKSVSYKLSSPMEGVETLFTTMALSIEDYQAVMEILPDVDSLTAAYNHVFITSIAGAQTQLTNFGETDARFPSEYMITVEIVGNSRQACDDVGAVVDDAFKRELEQIKEVDKTAQLNMIGTQYRGNINNYIALKQQAAFEVIQKIDTATNALKNNAIDKLSKKQKAYYNYLSTNGEMVIAEEEPVEETPRIIMSGIRRAVQGIILGFLFICFIIFVRYYVNGKINLGEEVEEYYDLPVLATFYSSGSRKGLFPGLIKKLLGADDVPARQKASAAAVDLCGMVHQTDENSLYLIHTSDCREDEKIVSMVSEAIGQMDAECSVKSGNPLEAVEDMQELTGAKNAVLVLHTKQTVLKELETILELCSRHQIRVLGALTVKEV